MTTPRRPRDAEKTRTDIEAAALELFAERGFAATATSEIARRAGVAEGTIFRHFPSKKALLIGVLRPLVERVVAPFATRSIRELLAEPHDSLELLLRALAADRIAFAEGLSPFVRVLLQEASLQPEVRELVGAMFLQQIYPLFCAQLDALKQRGQIDAELDNAVAVRTIVSVMAGYLLHTRVLRDTPPAPDESREIDQMVRVLARGLAPSP